jgi:hypothetical protein
LGQLSEIERLQARRRELVAESQRLRQQIAGELENLRPVAVWANRGYRVFETLWAAWPLVGGAATFALGRKRHAFLRKAAKAWTWFRLGKKAADLWQRYGSQLRRAQPQP